MGLPSLPGWGLWDLWGVPLVRARDSGASGISLWAGLGSLGPLGTDVYFIGKTLDSSQVRNAEQLSAGGAWVSGVSGISEVFLSGWDLGSLESLGNICLFHLE